MAKYFKVLIENQKINFKDLNENNILSINDLLNYLKSKELLNSKIVMFKNKLLTLSEVIDILKTSNLGFNFDGIIIPEDNQSIQIRKDELRGKDTSESFTEIISKKTILEQIEEKLFTKESNFITLINEKNITNNPFQTFGLFNVTTTEDNDISELVSLYNKNGKEIDFKTTYQESEYGYLVLKKDTWDYILKDNTQSLNESDKVTDIFNVELSDGTFKEIVIEITGINDTPTIENEYIILNEDNQIQGKITSFDIDSKTKITLDKNIDGLTINKDGTYIFDSISYDYLKQNEILNLTSTITILDEQGLSSTSEFKITLIGTNDIPKIQTISPMSFLEDDSVFYSSIRAEDLDNDAILTFSTTSDIDGFTLKSDGSYSFDPSHSSYQSLGKDNTLTLLIDIIVRDDKGAENTQNLVVMLTGTNDSPILNLENIQSITQDNMIFNGQIKSIDIDTNEILTYTSSSNINGFTLNSDGSYTFDSSVYNYLELNEILELQIPIKVIDEHGSSDRENLIIKIIGQNDSPIINSISEINILEDASQINKTITSNDVDSNSVFTFTTSESIDGLVFNTDGSFSFDPTHSAYQNLNEGEIKTLNVPITVTDEHNASDTKYLVINIVGTNDEPKIESKLLSIQEGNSLIKGYVEGVDIDTSAILTYSTTSNIAGFILNQNGTYSLDLNEYASLALDEILDLNIPIIVTDDNGASDSSFLSIKIIGTNAVPSIEYITQLDVNEDDSLISKGQIITNDVDNNAILTYSTNSLLDGFTLNSNGSYEFDPSYYQHLKNGEIQVITIPFTVSDENGAEVNDNLTIQIRGENDTPIIDSISQVNVYEDAQVVLGQIIASDADKDSTISFSTNASLAGFSLNNDGSYTFDPSISDYQSLNTKDTLTFTIPITVTDNEGTSDTKDLVIKLTGTNDYPVLTLDSSGATLEDTSTSINYTANDADDNIGIVGSALNGTVTINDNGTIAYTPNANYNGSDTITVTLSDESGASVTRTSTINVQATNDAPTIDEVISYDVTEEAIYLSTVIGRINASDTDANTTLVYSVNDVNSYVKVDNTGLVTLTQAGIDAINLDTINTDLNSFTYTVSISDGIETVTTEIQTIDITRVNENAPIYTLESGETVNENTLDTNTIVAKFTVSDIDDDDSVTYDFLNGNESAYFQINKDTGIVTLTTIGVTALEKETTASEINSYDIKVRATDNNNNTADSTVTISLTRENDNLPELLITSVGKLTEESVLSEDVVATFSVTDFDDNDSTIFTITNGNESGFFQINSTTGEITITQIGVDAINSDVGVDLTTFDLTIKIEDDAGNFDTESISVDITRINDTAPIVVIDKASVNENESVIVDVLVNDSDLDDGDTLTLKTVSAPLNKGTASIEDGKLVFDSGDYFDALAIGESEDVDIEYIVIDNIGNSSTSTATITVNGVNDAPTLTVDSTATVAEDGIVSITYAAADIDGTIATTTATVDSAKGTVVVNSDNTITFTAAANYHGDAVVTVVTTDDDGATATKTSTITITSDGYTLTPTVDLIDLSDTGSSNSDNITSDTTPTFSGTTEPNAIVKIFDELDNKIGEGTADENGNYNITTSVLSDGVHTIKVEASDSVSSASIMQTVTIDTGAVLSITNITSIREDVTDGGTIDTTAPDTNAGITKQIVAEISSDSDSTFTINNAKFEIVGDKVKVKSGSTFDYETSISESITVTATDKAGNTTSNEFIVDITDYEGSYNSSTTSEITGTSEEDILTGSSGNSTIYGGAGNDTITGGTGVNNLYADSGDDIVYITEGEGTGNEEFVHGGNGTDTVIIFGNRSDYIVDKKNDYFKIANKNTGKFLSIYNDVENIQFADVTILSTDVSFANDVIANASYYNIFLGTGNDIITVSTSNQFIRGGTGTDTVIFESNKDKYDIVSNNGSYSVEKIGTQEKYYIQDIENFEFADGTFTQETLVLTAQNDSEFSMQENTTKTITKSELLTNDTDQSISNLTITSVTSENGTVIVNVDGNIEFTPNTDYYGIATFTYTVSDGNDVDIAIVSIDVNDAPVAVVESVTLNEDAKVVIDVSSNDTDLDGTIDPTTVTIITQATHGTLSVDVTTGEVTYTPNANYNGTDSFAYTVKDNDGLVSNPATVSIDVISVNDTPIAVADASLTTNEDTNLIITRNGLLSNDSDIDGDVLTITKVTTTTNTHGTVSLIDGNGSASTVIAETSTSRFFGFSSSDSNGDYRKIDYAVYIKAGGSLETYVGGQQKETGFSYKSGDKITLERIDGKVSFLKNGVSFYTSTVESTGDLHVDTMLYSNGATLKDITIENNRMTSDVEFTNVGIGISATGNDLIKTGSNSWSGGAYSNQAIGQGDIIFTPDENYTGKASFEYTISDGNGAESTATVTLNVTSVNDVPTIEIVSTSIVNEDGTLTINAVDFTVSDEEDGVSTPTLSANNGTVIIDESGNIIYTPTIDYNGSDTITLSVTDRNGATTTKDVAITVTSVNDVAIVSSASVELTETNVVLSTSGILTSTDVDNDDNTFTANTITGTIGTFTIDTAGAWIFTANSTFDELNVGDKVNETFNITSVDGTASSVTIQINGTNDTPTLDAITAITVNEDDTTITGVITSDDLDNNSTATYTTTSSVSGFILNTDGSYSFDPSHNNYQKLNEGEIKTITIPVIVTDDYGVSSVSKDLVINLTGTNDDVSFDVNSNITFSSKDSITVTRHSTIQSDDLIKVDISKDYNFSATVTLGDENGNYNATNNQYLGVACYDIDKLMISRHMVNTGTAEKTTLSQDLNIGDTAIYVTDASTWHNGSSTYLAGFAIYGYENSQGGTYENYTRNASISLWGANAIVKLDDGTYKITLNKPWSGIAVESGHSVGNAQSGGTYNYTILSGDTLSEGVNNVETTMSGISQTTGFNEGTEYVKALLLANYKDNDELDSEGDAGGGVVSYSDIKLSITIQEDNDVNDDGDLTTNGILTFSDIDENASYAFSYTKSSETIGELELTTSDGEVNWTYKVDNTDVQYLSEGETKEEIFTIKIEDKDINGNLLGTFSEQEIRVVVTGTNDGPVAVVDSLIGITGTTDLSSIDKGTATDGATSGVKVVAIYEAGSSINLLEGKDELFTTAAYASNLSWKVDKEIGFNYMGSYNWFTAQGIDIYAFNFEGGIIKFGDGTLGIITSIGAGKDSTEDSYVYYKSYPSLSILDVVAYEDTPLTIDASTLLSNDTDLDGDTLSIQSVQDATHGTVKLVDGNVLFTPIANYNGAASFTYTISDGNGGTSTATTTLNVTSVNDAPVAVADISSSIIQEFNFDSNVTGWTNAQYSSGKLLIAKDTTVSKEIDFGSENAGKVVSISFDMNTVGGWENSGSSQDYFKVNVNEIELSNDSFGDTSTTTWNKSYILKAVLDGDGKANITLEVDSTASDEQIKIDNFKLVVSELITNTNSALTIAASTLLINDTDLDGDTLTIKSVQDATHGTVVVDSGNVVFTPTTNYNGKASFTYTISDGNGAASTSTVEVSVNSSGDYSTPLILDLDGDGVETLALSDGVKFDIDADGDLDKTGWVGSDDGLLVRDVNNDGIINDASELFGEETIKKDGTKASDGYDALREMDSNADGVINSEDELFNELRIWKDSNSDGISSVYELLSLIDANVSEISLASIESYDTSNGNIIGLKSTYLDNDGNEKETADVLFNYEENTQTEDSLAVEEQEIYITTYKVENNFLKYDAGETANLSEGDFTLYKNGEYDFEPYSETFVGLLPTITYSTNIGIDESFTPSYLETLFDNETFGIQNVISYDNSFISLELEDLLSSSDSLNFLYSDDSINISDEAELSMISSNSPIQNEEVDYNVKVNSDLDNLIQIDVDMF